MTASGETIMLKRLMIPLHFTSSAQAVGSNILVQFYPSYPCLRTRNNSLPHIVYLDVKFPNCNKLYLYDPCTPNDTDDCYNKSGAIIDNHRVLIWDLFTDDKTAPRRIAFAIRYQELNKCSKQIYMRIDIKESYNSRIVETGYVRLYLT